MFGSSVVATAALQDGAITADKVGAGEIGTSALANLSIVEGKLANGAVTTSKLGTGAVETSNVGDLQITVGKLAGNITPAKLDLTATFDFTSGVLQVATPSNSSDAAPKSYVDSVAAGLSVKENVRVATEANVDITNLPASISSVTMASGNRVLLLNQTDATENGVYSYTSSGSSMSRATDMDEGSDFPGAFLFALEGDFAEQGFVCSNDGTVTLGSTNIAFQRFTGLGQISVNNGLEKQADTIGIADSGVTTARVADGAITSAKLGSGSVLTAAVGDAQITQGKLANDSVGAAQVIDGAIDTVALANSSVTNGKLSTDAVSSVKIQDGAITSSKLGTAAVQTSAVGDAQITGVKIANDAVDSQHIADGAINASSMFSSGVVNDTALASASVTSSKIGAGAVGTSALATSAVQEGNIQDGAVTSGKLGITFAQEGFQISGTSTNSVTLAQSLSTNEAKAVLVFKNGLSLRNATALGDTASDEDEFNVSGATVTFGANLADQDGLMVWYFY
jgi:trimeric autotransporter adhesin